MSVRKSHTLGHPFVKVFFNIAPFRKKTAITIYLVKYFISLHPTIIPSRLRASLLVFLKTLRLLDKTEAYAIGASKNKSHKGRSSQHASCSVMKRP